ncbi:hypothetical protein GCM10010218_24540 [Streptomyces mashuensis]|uniref:Uncharacterized protein n=1 Tax=Streptomyces mashuensis TaxID=33904 RepID=A0A919B2A4_9ACTN|nr:hypothetical protein [Streptomyces mashuensis]GHF42481.1 hypothetical protein GCM10010218_24540 [Streptomyces mashuensis]
MTDRLITASKADHHLPALLALAAEYQQQVEAAWAYERKQREVQERRDVVARAAACVARDFPNTLARVLTAGSWTGYPSGSEGPAMAVAPLGAGLFLLRVTERGLDGPPDELFLLCPCPCGKYVEVLVDSEYDLAFVLDDLQRTSNCEELGVPLSQDEG